MTENDPISPNHYKGFSNGAEPIDITEHLTSNAGQAVQYIVRSCKFDGVIKGDPIEDLSKAIWFLEREKGRLQSALGEKGDGGDSSDLRYRVTFSSSEGDSKGLWQALEDYFSDEDDDEEETELSRKLSAADFEADRLALRAWDDELFEGDVDV